MALPFLPEELLERICSYLCPHCQTPHDIPNTDSPCVQTSKATLARLCLVSKRLLAIAQPILYHYYATGNIIGPLNPKVSSYPTADDKLPSFLRTIIHRPILATHIRTLQLQETQSPNLPAFAPELLPLFNSTSEAHGIRAPIAAQWVIDPTLPRPKDAIEKKTRIAIHLWLRELAIILTPRTSHLIFGHSPFLPRTHIEPSSRLLPALTSLSFRNGVNGYNLAMMLPLLRMAPNLTSLHATDIFGYYGEGLGVSAPLSLPGVRRLVVEGMRMDGFCEMVGWCGGLRDVEYHYHRNFYGPEILGALAPLRGVLRRFCVMFISGRLASYSDVSAPYEYLMPKSQPETIQSLQEFCQLEELVIDQWAFNYYGNGHGGSKRLVTLLPSSIQTVHFRYIHRSMQAELQQLALAVPNKFPKLRRLKIGIADNCKPEWRHELEKMRSVEADFADVGVQVEWGVDGGYPCPGSAMPRHTVFPESELVVRRSADSASFIEMENTTTQRGRRRVIPRIRERISSFRSTYLSG
ncbi:hypothetical protein VE01_02929 [Pseudogymnoascus verrucosus]|uniref:F-box domain-containing protein n=1 Tax=Pseudogymnoascus verrucosus TaxID=342668 RepID=A0A1B8GUF7_9PEZI|nr:uncharacterized protein VE01_02929 [Pseudogymnoascus verrucosus]OBT99463.1 hypothetical protein VE01_02929 [Pseudogymnoascus verrucosus]